MKKRALKIAGVAFISLVVAGLVIPSLTLVAGASPMGMVPPLETPLNLTAINSSLPNGTLPATFTPAPTPITLVHLVLNQTSLPGERYMAFGPSVFDISLSPILLVLLVGGIGVAGGAWYVFGRRRRDD
jgi:hypothetical protein